MCSGSKMGQLIGRFKLRGPLRGSQSCASQRDTVPLALLDKSITPREGSSW
jgi:hypothetical protein